MAAASSASAAEPLNPHIILIKFMSNPGNISLTMQSIVHNISKVDSSKMLCTKGHLFMSGYFITRDKDNYIQGHSSYLSGHIYSYTWADAYIREIDDMKKNEPEYFERMHFPELAEIYEKGRIYYLDDNYTMISELKEYISTCEHNLVFIPIMLINIAGFRIPLDITDHVNGILISKKDGKFLVIEPRRDPEKIPETRDDVIMEEQIESGYIKLITALGIENPVNVSLYDVVCPQAVTNDINCIFWTLLICQAILMRSDDLDHVKEVIRFYSSKPKGELVTIIQEFKAKLIREIIPEYLRESGETWPDIEKFNIDFPGYNGAGRRHKKTRKRKIRKRKTRRRKSKKRLSGIRIN